MRDNRAASIKHFPAFASSDGSDIACQVLRSKNKRLQAAISPGNLCQVDHCPCALNNGDEADLSWSPTIFLLKRSNRLARPANLVLGFHLWNNDAIGVANQGGKDILHFKP